MHSISFYIFFRHFLYPFNVGLAALLPSLFIFRQSHRQIKTLWIFSRIYQREKSLRVPCQRFWFVCHALYWMLIIRLKLLILHVGKFFEAKHFLVKEFENVLSVRSEFCAFIRCKIDRFWNYLQYSVPHFTGLSFYIVPLQANR